MKRRKRKKGEKVIRTEEAEKDVRVKRNKMKAGSVDEGKQLKDRRKEV